MYLLIQPEERSRFREAVVRNGNRLQQHRAARTKRAGAGLEERVPILAADGLEHLYRDELVEGSLDVPVIAVPDVDPILQAGLADTPPRQLELLAGDRDAGHTAAGRARGVDGKASPPRADLQHVIVGSDSQLLDDHVVLADLGRVEVRRVGPIRARVGEGLVQEEPEELIPQVVVGVDVALTAPLGIGTAPVLEEVHNRHGQTRRAVEVHARRIVKSLAEQRREIVGLPFTVHVRLADAG